MDMQLTDVAGWKIHSVTPHEVGFGPIEQNRRLKSRLAIGIIRIAVIPFNQLETQYARSL
ncbi:MAG: hypothetical protein ABSC37_10715 [Xanthobacteraceae bacterium]|jgi:hypothetical protein